MNILKELFLLSFIKITNHLLINHFLHLIEFLHFPSKQRNQLIFERSRYLRLFEVNLIWKVLITYPFHYLLASFLC